MSDEAQNVAMLGDADTRWADSKGSSDMAQLRDTVS